MFYLDNIFSDSMSNTEKIIAILRARGILIDNLNGHYYVSDNASIYDVRYIMNLFAKFSLGKVMGGDNLPSEDIIYDAIRPRAIELIIDSGAKPDDAASIFESDGPIGCEADEDSIRWSQFAYKILDSKLPVSILEPYVSYYVKAVSACGVFTYLACDGNHRKGGKVIVKARHPSDIWHELLWLHIVGPAFGDVPFIGDGISFSYAGSRQKIYRLVYEIADYLYRNRVAIREIKKKSIECLTRKIRRQLRADELERHYRRNCEKILSENRKQLK